MTASVLINIDVDDIDRAESFYGRAFGLTVGRRLGPEVVELLGADAPLYLLAKPAGTAAAAGPGGTRRDYRRHWTPVHLDFLVEDLEPALQRARDAGAELEGEIREHSWGRIAQIADPFGHGICLLQFQGRGYDEIAG
ncbi:MAG: VOC family protein [Tistlia sp.]|uniref:VOC family protein n=1 Tax=Tistlia sp. TaxID=3057121 RepID=UPI0034A1BF65